MHQEINNFPGTTLADLLDAAAWIQWQGMPATLLIGHYTGRF